MNFLDLERELKKQHTSPHAIKREYLGRRAEVSRYDIYVDKETGQLAIFTHTTKKFIEVTTYFI